MIPFVFLLSGALAVFIVLIYGFTGDVYNNYKYEILIHSPKLKTTGLNIKMSGLGRAVIFRRDEAFEDIFVVKYKGGERKMPLDELKNMFERGFVKPTLPEILRHVF